MTNTVYRLYDFTPLPASVHILSDFKPLTNGVKPRSMNIYQLEELTPLVTSVKSYIYTPGLEEMTPLVTGVKSYIYTLPTE